jgi:transcriptional regulator with XRE-family HTH domain
MRAKARKALPRWRKEHEYSLAEVAEIIGKSRSMIHHYEMGRRGLTLMDRYELFRLTRIPMRDWLEAGEEAEMRAVLEAL